MTQKIKYIGQNGLFFEVAVTGKQSNWKMGQIEERSNSEAALLLATGLFEKSPEPVMAVSNPLTGGITWTAAEFAAITPEAGKFYLVEA